MFDQLVLGAVFFGKNIWGLITRPYETYRKIVNSGKLSEIIYIAIFVEFYFALASLVKVAAFRPFLLTRQFLVLSLAAIGLFGVAILTLAFGGYLFGVKSAIKKITLPWAYTFGPTFCWFLFTSILYVLIPPPRSTNIWGITFSIVYLILSVVLLFWKIMLGFLAIRFAYRLDMVRIIGVYFMAIISLGISSYFMYRWGIFKVPFI
jgi:hypothetical protein